MKVCFRKEETIMDKVDAVIVNAKENNRIIETIELTYHEFQAFAKLLYKLESISPTTDKITDYVWYRGVKVINTGWTFDAGEHTEDPTANLWELYLESQKKRELGPSASELSALADSSINYHELYGGSNKKGSIPVDEDEAILWGESVLDPENEHRKNVDAREALDKLTCCREECCEDKMQDGIQGFFHDLLSWTKEHPTSKVLEDMDEADRKCKSDYMDTLYKNVAAQEALDKIDEQHPVGQRCPWKHFDEQMIYEGDEEPAEDLLVVLADEILEEESAKDPLDIEGIEPCIKHLNAFNKKQRIYMKRVCTSCKKLYQPTMEDDGDTCPGCARY